MKVYLVRDSDGCVAGVRADVVSAQSLADDLLTATDGFLVDVEEWDTDEPQWFENTVIQRRIVPVPRQVQDATIEVTLPDSLINSIRDSVDSGLIGCSNHGCIWDGFRSTPKRVGTNSVCKCIHELRSQVESRNAALIVRFVGSALAKETTTDAPD